jgi:hypothetical protein
MPQPRSRRLRNPDQLRRHERYQRAVGDSKRKLDNKPQLKGRLAVGRIAGRHTVGRSPASACEVVIGGIFPRRLLTLSRLSSYRHVTRCFGVTGGMALATFPSPQPKEERSEESMHP